MTLSILDLVFYCGGLFILFLTPGPVWLALLARSLSGGAWSALPLAFGVVVGDILWPFLAIMGLAALTAQFDALLPLLKWFACGMFLYMGLQVVLKADKPIRTNSRLTKSGALAGFVAGLAVILSNPKAILFYMGLLPGFFDLTSLNRIDMALIVLASALVPFLGNIMLVLIVARMQAILKSEHARRRLNQISGVLLIAVGLIIPLN